MKKKYRVSLRDDYMPSVAQISTRLKGRTLYWDRQKGATSQEVLLNDENYRLLAGTGSVKVEEIVKAKAPTSKKADSKKATSAKE